MENQNSKYTIWQPLILAAFGAFCLLIGYRFNPHYQDGFLILDKTDPSAQLSTGGTGRMEEILRYIETSYVDTVDNDALLESAIEVVMSQLDPFSSYVPPKELEDYNEQLDGVFKGIGINYVLFQDSIFITDVMEDSNARTAGLQRGDTILKIDTATVSGTEVDIDKVRKLIKSKKEEKFDLALLKVDGSKSTVSLSRNKISLPSANISYQVDDESVYLKIDRFSSNTYKQFMETLEQYNPEDQEYNLIIDLRDNPGGYLPETIKLLSQLIEDKGKILTYTEGSHRNKKEYKSTGRGFFKFKKIAVLINNYSASASEIVAGALQDWDRAIVIGQDSYGKGLVQEISDLKNGGALRLTVARYMTPSGRSIQRPYAMQDSMKNKKDSTIYKSKILGRDLVGGGGVNPDFVVNDIDIYKGCKKFDFDLVHGFLLKKYPLSSPFDSFEDFNDNFKIDEVGFRKFVDFSDSERDNLPIVNDCVASFEILCKSLLAKFWYDASKQQQVLNDDNPMVNFAIEKLSSDQTLHAMPSNPN